MAYGALEKKVKCPNQAWESGCPDCLPHTSHEWDALNFLLWGALIYNWKCSKMNIASLVTNSLISLSKNWSHLRLGT